METPVALVHASASLLPRFTAEESFLASTRVAVGSGSLDADDARAVTAEWRSCLERATRAVVRQPSVTDLAAIGVSVIEVPRG